MGQEAATTPHLSSGVTAGQAPTHPGRQAAAGRHTPPARRFARVWLAKQHEADATDARSVQAAHVDAWDAALAGGAVVAAAGPPVASVPAVILVIFVLLLPPALACRGEG